MSNAFDKLMESKHVYREWGGDRDGKPDASELSFLTYMIGPGERGAILYFEDLREWARYFSNKPFNEKAKRYLQDLFTGLTSPQEVDGDDDPESNVFTAYDYDAYSTRRSGQFSFNCCLTVYKKHLRVLRTLFPDEDVHIRHNIAGKKRDRKRITVILKKD